MLFASEQRAKGTAVQRPRTRRRQETLLHPAMAGKRVLDAREREFTLLHCIDDRLQGRELLVVRGPAQEHHITSCRDCADRPFLCRVARADRLHVEIVTDDHAVEPERLLEEAVHDGGRHRCGALFVERRHQDVRGHDRGDAGIDSRPERDKLHRLQTVRWMLDERQLEMRVGGRVAMAREVFAARGNPCRLQSLDQDPAKPCDILSPVAQGAIANNRVRRVGQDVEHRCVIEIDTDGDQLSRETFGETSHETFIARPPQRHHRRPDCERRPKPRYPSALLVHAHPQRRVPRERLCLAGELGHPLG